MGRKNRPADSKDIGTHSLNIFSKGLLYFHTVKYLKPIQTFGRIKFKLKKTTIDQSPVPCIRPLTGEWKLPIQKNISMIGQSEFCFLNHVSNIQDQKSWTENNTLLWLYNLHYFDDLNAYGANKRYFWHKNFMERWVAENPPGLNIGWDPYPTSLRIVNWIKWYFSGAELSNLAVDSLACQIRFLMQQIEWHIQGNHLLANAKALVFAGAFFQGGEAEKWLFKGMKILQEQLDEQILDDGGHFERSPMYHSIVFDDLLDLLNLIETYPEVFANFNGIAEKWRIILANMRCWLDVMCHPDGEISFFNDAAFGIAPTPSELFSYAERLKVPAPSKMKDVTHLEQSGYIRVNTKNAVLIIDVAPIEPDYLPGHAHADTLSFELSLNKKRVIVNSGTSQYGIGPQREFERSTAAHNTMEIDGKNSSEVWAGFRVARRANLKIVNVYCNGDETIIEAEHDGYLRLSGAPIHHRKWHINNKTISITDEVRGSFRYASTRFYFHPKLSVYLDGTKGTVECGTTKTSFMINADLAELVPSNWYPQFGKSEKTSCLTLHCIRKSHRGNFRSTTNFSLEY